MSDREISGIPWWRAAIDNPVKRARTTFADVWDALFGRLETFYKVELDGSWCMVESQEVPDWLEPDVSGFDQYTITPVRMTRRQFDNLPEFEGF